jgi:hypothetical protein
MVWWRTGLQAVLAGTAGMVVLLAADRAAAQKATGKGGDIAGTWNGGGRVVFPSGDSERARCRAAIRRQVGTGYTLTATCATASARIVQSASVQKVGASSYAGRFRNAEYDISGSIRITQKGGRLSASLAGSNGSAAMLSFTR